MSLLVLYHAECTDGAVAAWAVWRRYPDAELIAVSYREPPPDVTGRDVFIVDFSYPRDTILGMKARAASLCVFDHHRTAAEDLQGLDFCVFDMMRSGAGITWDVLHGAPRPWLVDYVEDRDLWRWKLPDSKMINAYLQTVPRDVAALSEALNDGPDVARERGLVAERVRRDYIEGAKRGAYAARIEGESHDSVGVNAGAWSNSELLGELAEAAPTGCAFAYIEHASGGYSYSLRSRKGGPDVSVIAQRFGGGGHAAAAGFRTERLVHVRLRRTPY